MSDSWPPDLAGPLRAMAERMRFAGNERTIIDPCDEPTFFAWHQNILEVVDLLEELGGRPPNENPDWDVSVDDRGPDVVFEVKPSPCREMIDGGTKGPEWAAVARVHAYVLDWAECKLTTDELGLRLLGIAGRLLSVQGLLRGGSSPATTPSVPGPPAPGGSSSTPTGEET